MESVCGGGRCVADFFVVGVGPMDLGALNLIVMNGEMSDLARYEANTMTRCHPSTPPIHPPLHSASSVKLFYLAHSDPFSFLFIPFYFRMQWEFPMSGGMELKVITVSFISEWFHSHIVFARDECTNFGL